MKLSTQLFHNHSFCFGQTPYLRSCSNSSSSSGRSQTRHSLWHSNDQHLIFNSMQNSICGASTSPNGCTTPSRGTAVPAENHSLSHMVNCLSPSAICDKRPDSISKYNQNMCEIDVLSTSAQTTNVGWVHCSSFGKQV